IRSFHGLSSFFFSSRRRHTRFSRDWSSDVCSSDLGMTAHYLATSTFPLGPGHRALVHAAAGGVGQLLVQVAKLRGATVYGTVSKIGRASCRERVWIVGVAGRVTESGVVDR